MNWVSRREGTVPKHDSTSDVSEVKIVAIIYEICDKLYSIGLDIAKVHPPQLGCQNGDVCRTGGW